MQIFGTNWHVLLQDTALVDHVLVQECLDRSSLDLELAESLELHVVQHLKNIFTEGVEFDGHLLVDVRTYLFWVDVAVAFELFFIHVEVVLAAKFLKLCSDFGLLVEVCKYRAWLLVIIGLVIKGTSRIDLINFGQAGYRRFLIGQRLLLQVGPLKFLLLFLLFFELHPSLDVLLRLLPDLFN